MNNNYTNTKDATHWAEPRPLTEDKASLASFPVECLPPIMADYVQAVAEHTQTNPDMSAVSMLGLLASCNHKKYVIEAFAGYQEPLNLYTVFIAEPGERKSAVLKYFTDVLFEYQEQENLARRTLVNESLAQKELLELEIKGIKEQLYKKKEKENIKKLLMEKVEELHNIKEVTYLRLLCDDCSPEALVSLLYQNKGATSVVSAEGGIFDIMTGRYGNKPNLDVFLKGHSGDLTIKKIDDIIVKPTMLDSSKVVLNKGDFEEMKILCKKQIIVKDKTKKLRKDNLFLKNENTNLKQERNIQQQEISNLKSIRAKLAIGKVEMENSSLKKALKIAIEFITKMGFHKDFERYKSVTKGMEL